ncbi:hypothetical protein BDW60DRAFT_171248 [Aspergillus nidulans var. acristatus]
MPARLESWFALVPMALGPGFVAKLLIYTHYVDNRFQLLDRQFPTYIEDSIGIQYSICTADPADSCLRKLRPKLECWTTDCFQITCQSSLSYRCLIDKIAVKGGNEPSSPSATPGMLRHHNALFQVHR